MLCKPTGLQLTCYEAILKSDMMKKVFQAQKGKGNELVLWNCGKVKDAGKLVWNCGFKSG